jgi:hypothetical protein
MEPNTWGYIVLMLTALLEVLGIMLLRLKRTAAAPISTPSNTRSSRRSQGIRKATPTRSSTSRQLVALQHIAMRERYARGEKS